MENVEDSQILEDVLAGEIDRYALIVERYQKPVYNCAWAILQNCTDAADVAQDVFVRFHRCMDQFDRNRPLKPYLLTMTANCAKNLLRSKKRRRTIFEEMPENIDSIRIPSEENPASTMIRTERIEGVRNFVRELPTTFREVCSLFYLSECSCHEVSGILKISEGSVKTTLHRARKKLLERGLHEWKQT